MMSETTNFEEIRRQIENIPVGICVYQRFDNGIRCIASNRLCSDLMGIRDDGRETIAEVSERVHPEDRARYLQETTALFDERPFTSGIYRICCGTGRDYRWYRLDGRLNESPDGGALAYFTYTDVSNTVEAQEELERSRQTLNSIVRYVPGGVFVYSAEEDEEFSFISENMLFMLGYTEQEFRKKYDNKFSHMIVEAERKATLKSIWDQIAVGPYDTCVYQIEKKDGSLIRVHDEGHIITDDSGKRWFYVVIVDITNAEKTKEERFNRIIQELLVTNPLALCTFRLNLTQNSCSDGHGTSEYIRQLLAADTVDELLQKLAGIIVDNDEKQRFISDFSRASLVRKFQSGIDHSEITYRRMTDGGKAHWVTTYFHVLLNPYTGDTEAIAYSVDSDHVHKESQIVSLITSEEYECIGLADVKTHILTDFYVSERYKAQGWNLPDRFEDRVKALQVQTIPERDKKSILEGLSFDTVVETLAQRAVYTVAFSVGKHRKQITFRYLEKDHEEIMFALADITESFEHEEVYAQQLRTALAAAEQASIAKTEFLSRMSHEIRTPMNAIIGLDAIALQEKGLAPTTEDHLQKIGISARFLLSLINDILDMSRIESGKMVLRSEVFDFEEFIDGINTIMYEQCRSSGLQYECVLKSDTEQNYVGDKTKLQQVLINILGNAVKFTPKDGKIHFTVEQIARTGTKARLRFEISDTGIGIDKAFLPHLFEAFSQENRGRTSRYGGTGLGLAISQNIVRLMNGEISVRSIKGAGSVFLVEVEMDISGETIRRREEMAPMLPLSTLIVDDDDVVCRHTQLLLSQAGLKAEWVSSGKEAVERVKQGHMAGNDYDLILLDWSMPEMDGVETARAIRSIVGPEVTIIIMTAFDWAEIEEKARAAGVDLFLRKPVFVSSVTRAFEQALLNKKPEAPHQKDDFDFTGRRVLLAEDNEINAEIARNILEMKHCTVDVAENGVAAIEAFSENPPGYYDAILMDVRMPVMDGLETTRTIRAMKRADGKRIPIIAMTANAFQEDVDASLDAGMNAHLAKPIEPSVLYQTLERFLRKKTV